MKIVITTPERPPVKYRDQKIKSKLHYTRGIMLKRVTSGGAHLRGLALGEHSFEETSQRRQSCQSGLGCSGRARAWILKHCRASIRPDAGAKPRFSVSYRVFAIAGIKQGNHLVALV